MASNHLDQPISICPIIDGQVKLGLEPLHLKPDFLNFDVKECFRLGFVGDVHRIMQRPNICSLGLYHLDILVD